MLNYIFLLLCKNKNKTKNKGINTLFYKEQFKYLKTTHTYHLVDPSPWRSVVKYAMFFLTQRVYLTKKIVFARYFLFLCSILFKFNLFS